MGDVIDFKTRKHKVIDFSNRCETALNKYKAKLSSGNVCPFCKKELQIPSGYSASFTCRGGKEHRHMKDQRLLEEK